MRENYFENYTEYQRTRLKYLLIKLMSSLIKKDTILEDGFVLLSSNIFLQKLVKPSWFKDDIESVRSVYEYIDYTCENWDIQKKYVEKIKIPLLYPEDVISGEEKNVIRGLVNEVANISFNIKSFPMEYQRAYNGQPISELDINCISKKNYSFIKSFLLEIKKRKVA